MPLIFSLIFLSFSAWSLDPNCDPQVVESECYNRVCQGSRYIPTNAKVLAAEIKKQKITVSPELQSSLKDLKTLATQLSKKIKVDVPADFYEKYALEMSEKPDKGFVGFNKLMMGKVSCAIVKGKCRLTFNDMMEKEFPAKELAPAYKKLVIANQAIQTAGYFQNSKNANKTLINFLSILEDEKRSTPALRELKKKLKSKEFIDSKEVRKLFDLNVVMKFKVDTIKSVKVPLALALKQSVEKAKNRNVIQDFDDISYSCKTADYLLQKIKSQDLEKKIPELAAQVIAGFETQFLPKLSTESQKMLKGKITPDLFRVIDVGLESLAFHLSTNTLKMTLEGENIIEHARSVNSLKSYTCNVTPLFGYNFLGARGDHYEDGFINLSPFVLAMGDTEIMAHEMGHMLTDLMMKNLSSHSKSKILALRKCLNSQHSDKRKTLYEEYFFKGDAYRTEEDFADWFAATLKVGRVGLGCELTMMAAVSGAVKKPLYASQKEDIHSNNLFRELHTRIVRGENLPQVCLDLIELHPDDRPKKCEL